jgi:DNA invertase Pin-like site-specific DNA recombinase
VLARIEEFREGGVLFRSLTENLDTTGPMGTAMVTIMSAFAQLERDIITERTRAGLLAAAARGKRPGRPRKLKPPQEQAMLGMQEAGSSVTEIATAFSVSVATAKRGLATARESRARRA